MYDDFQIISANLKYLREKSGYTQEQLAEITGLSVSHISKVRSRFTQGRNENIHKYSAGIECRRK